MNARNFTMGGPPVRNSGVPGSYPKYETRQTASGYEPVTNNAAKSIEVRRDGKPPRFTCKPWPSPAHRDGARPLRGASVGTDHAAAAKRRLPAGTRIGLRAVCAGLRARGLTENIMAKAYW